MTSISPRYYVVLRDQSYHKVAMFDSWSLCSYTKEVNSVYTYEFSIQADDPRRDLFELDGLFEIYRAVPGCNVPWYREFIGLHRADRDSVSEKGEELFSSIGVGLNDFLARTIINYPPATIKSYKDTVAETAMKEYVEENCGASATIANNRERDGVLQDFLVETDGAHGIAWEGDKAWNNLLDVLKDISRLSQIDFDVEWDEDVEKFYFRTFVDQLGEDRTTQGLDSSTGLNSAGNAPVVFSLALGNMQNAKREYNRISESNVVTVTGEGDGATVEVQVRANTSAIDDSPWNRREVSRPQSGYESEMQMFGDEVLEELSAKDILEFTPLMQSSCLYGKHFFFGDKITTLFRGNTFHKRIYSISNSIQSFKEDLKITFSDLQ